MISVLRWWARAAMPVAAIAVAVIATQPSRPTPRIAHQARTPAAGDPTQLVMLSPSDERRIGVTYAEAKVVPLQREIRTSGQVVLDERRTAVVSARVDGWVERVNADFSGKQVRKGEALLSIYSPMLVAAEDELLLALRLDATLSNGDSATRVRAADLARSARMRLVSWDVGSDDIDGIVREGASRRLVTLRSPIDGFVIDKNVVQGQRVMTGDPLFRLANLSIVWIDGSVHEQDLAAILPGQRASVELEALPGTVLNGQVSYIYPMLDLETRTARVRVEVRNADHRLQPGMFATLRLISEDSRALIVPRTAVLVTGQRTLVFVKRPDGMLEPRAVTIGRSTDDRTAILSGLVPGDSVVASATFLVDAESNLGTAMGGMGNMPGMDIAPPSKKRTRP
jgi:multidrug efflux pump subunit AcrA (membrane-fusion protein)